jgi:NAD(P)-dependent dehydrogenase (short-subunit alcohol dehydrogenase family)
MTQSQQTLVQRIFRRDIVKRVIRRALSAALGSRMLGLNPALFAEHQTRMSDLAMKRDVGRLFGKVAIVTGAASGLGQAIAVLFAREGANVVVADINDNGGQETVKRITDNGGSGNFLLTDVTSDAAIQDMVSRTLSLHARVDILVNNAGINIEGGVLTLSPEKWQQALEMNLTSVYRCCRFIVPKIISAGGGSIINMASVQGVAGFLDSSGYAAAKGGLISLTRQLARQFADKRVRVNSISPGVVLTPIFDHAKHREIMFAIVSNHTPLGHIGVPEDIAFACLFLASEESSYITGHNLVVDGGMTMRGV